MDLRPLTVPFLVALVGCSNFDSEATHVAVPDLRADLFTTEGFISQLTDINGDGDLDLAMFQGGTGELRVALGSGAASFQPEEVYSLPDDVRFLRDSFAWHALTDINGDGVADILGARVSGDLLDFTFYRGIDTGFAPGAQWGTVPKDGELGDINGDGIADWIRRGDAAAADYTAFVTDDASHAWHVYLGGGTNLAESPTEWPVPQPYTISVGDWDGDGLTDALGWDGVADTPYLPWTREDGSVAINLYRGTTTGFATAPTAWTAPHDLSMEVGTRYIALDVTCDGRVDLVRRLAREGAWVERIEFYANTGTGFSTVNRLSLPMPDEEGGTVRPILADLTGDGCRDLIYSTRDGGEAFGGELDPHWVVFEAL